MINPRAGQLEINFSTSFVQSVSNMDNCNIVTSKIYFKPLQYSVATKLIAFICFAIKVYLDLFFNYVRFKTSQIKEFFPNSFFLTNALLSERNQLASAPKNLALCP